MLSALRFLKGREIYASSETRSLSERFYRIAISSTVPRSWDDECLDHYAHRHSCEQDKHERHRVVDLLESMWQVHAECRRDGRQGQKQCRHDIQPVRGSRLVLALFGDCVLQTVLGILVHQIGSAFDAVSLIATGDELAILRHRFTAIL